MTIIDASCDIAVLGAGMAGTCAAHMLAQAGWRVALIDSHDHCLDCFKAEKIEPDQVELLRSMGLFEIVAPVVERIHAIHVVGPNGEHRVERIEQYGAPYHDMVNALRRALPPQVRSFVGKVRDVETSHARPIVSLDDGRAIAVRAVVVATGTASAIATRLGVKRTMLEASHCLSFGFNLRRPDGRAFEFDSITYYANSARERVGYATLFRMPGTMRVNLFTYWSPKEPRVREFIAAPIEALARLFPGLFEMTGEIELDGKVEAMPVDLFSAIAPARNGLVLVGDAFLSVSPATGTGLSKVLTDVDLLCREFMPRWLDSTRRVEAASIAAFYASAAKKAVDERSLVWARSQRELGTLDAAHHGRWHPVALRKRVIDRVSHWRERHGHRA